MITLPVLFNPSTVGRYLFRNIVWQTDNNQILITFDDSPNPKTTPALLKLLNANNIRAVFFCIGRNANEHPGLMNEILAEEHIIGNHAFNHSNLRTCNRAEQAMEILRTEETIQKITGVKTQLFRPPYGKFSRELLKTVHNTDYTMMLWSLLTYDYKNDIKIFRQSLPFLRQNSIVVMHDHPKCAATVHQGLPYLLEKIDKQNFTIGRPEVCLKSYLS